MEEELCPCTVCGKPVLWGTRHPVCGRRVMGAESLAIDLEELRRIANPEEAAQRAAMWREADPASPLNADVVMADDPAQHCGNCAAGIPDGPDNCSKCGRQQQYSHWTPNWRKFPDVPAPVGPVLVTSASKVVWMADFAAGENVWRVGSGRDMVKLPPEAITHWMPLPAAAGLAASGAPAGVQACPKGKGDCAKVLPDKRCFGCPSGVSASAGQSQPTAGTDGAPAGAPTEEKP